MSKELQAPVDDLRERFILFCASKGDQAYNWSRTDQCACGTFIRECLTTTYLRKRHWWSFRRTLAKKVDLEQAGQVWARWNYVAEKRPTTYRALRERVSAV